MVREDGHRVRPNLDSDERQRIQEANQIFLRKRKNPHDRDEQFKERDIKEATKSVRWLREVAERYPNSLEAAYEDALVTSGLPEEDQAYLQKGTEQAGGFSSFVRRDLSKLEEASFGEREQPGGSAVSTARQDLMCGLVAGLLAGGTMMGNSFYFGFAVGMARKNDCW